MAGDDAASRASAWRGPACALAGACIALSLASAADWGSRIDQRCFDVQADIVRSMRTDASVVDDIVLVGIDEASLEAARLPIAMLHAPIGQALQAIASARPRALGLDVALPGLSFDHLRAGSDAELVRGLRLARAAGGLALALDLGADGSPRVPLLRLLLAAGGPRNFGLPLFPLDCDGVVRRFDPDPARAARVAGRSCGMGEDDAPEAVGASPATFVDLLARAAGAPAALAHPGWIDTTRGADFTYIPLQTVLAWQRAGDRARLDAHFARRVVLLGSVLPDLDRLRLARPLASWDASAAVPGLVVNAQVLRNALGAGLVQPVRAPLRALLLGALAMLAFVQGDWLRWAALAASVLALFVLACVLLAAGWQLPLAAPIAAGAAAVLLRSALEFSRARRERDHLARSFAAYLSPQVLRQVLERRRGPGQGRRALALLFADLRGFTAWSESTDPDRVRTALNRYYAAITPVLHAQHGTIDNFRGDGIMVMFGAPEYQAQCCDRALAAARAVCATAAGLNASPDAAHADFAFEVAIGLSYGEVVYGDLGSAERKDFTALGDAVNVAAHLRTWPSASTAGS